MKKMVCFLISMVMVIGFAACNGRNKDSANVDKGSSNAVLKYMEEEIKPAKELKNPMAMQVNSQKQFVVYHGGTQKPEYLVLSADGKVQRKISCDFEGQGNLFALDSLDNLYIVCTLVNENGMEQCVYIVDPKGKQLDKINIGSLSANDPESYKKMVTGIAVDSKGNMILSRAYEQILMLSRDGKEQRTFGDAFYQSTSQKDSEDNLIIYGLDTASYQYTLQKYNSITGENLWSKTIDHKTRSGMTFSGDIPKMKCDRQDGSIYLLTDSGVTKFDSDGNSTGSILDFKEHTLLASGFTPTELCMDAQKSLYIMTTSVNNGVPANEGNFDFSFYRYSLQEVKEDNKIQLTLSVPASSRLLEVAVSKFNKANPGYRIVLQEAGSGTNGITVDEKYVNTLNTELMSGKGPDIISVAGLPYEKYIAKNIFVELTQLMTNDSTFEGNRFYTNLFDAMKHNGKLYTMPVCYTLNAVFPNRKALSDKAIAFHPATWTWDDFQSIADQASAENVYMVPPNVSYMGMLEVLLKGSYGRFIDMQANKASFDSQEFVKVLELAKRFGSDASESEANDPIGALFESAQRSTVLFAFQSIPDFIMLSSMKVLYGSDLEIANLPGSSAMENGAVFSGREIFAINRNSKNQKMAWEFIKILLSDEIQSMDDLYGFPVNRTAFRTKADKNNTLLSSEGIMISVSAGGSGEPVTPKALSEQEVDKVNRYIESLTVNSHFDPKIQEMIQVEAEGYFTGNKSAEEAARAIQSKVNIYLGE